MNNWTLYALYHAMNGGKMAYPESWSEVQSYIRSGKHRSVFAVGDRLVCQRNGVDIVWDVIGIDHDTPSDPQYKNSLTLQTHECIAELQFDAEEAFYSQTEILPAGIYNFTVVSQTWYSADVGKTFCFTLNNDVPAGGQLVLSATYNATLAGKTIKVYSGAASTTVTETAVLSEGSDGDSLGNCGNAVIGNFNSFHRVFFGSNNYKESALRQWLCSGNAAGQVWTPQTKWDRPPSWASNIVGFLNGLDNDFLSVVGNTHITVSRNTVTDGGGTDVIDDKFFLLSRREIYGGNETSVIEGEPYPYYSDYSKLTAPGVGADANRVKYRNGAAKWWWLRTPYSGGGYGVRTVGTTGYVHYGFAGGVGGVALACNIY